MPMLTTLRIGLPVWPVQAPLRTCSRERGHAVEHLVHLGPRVRRARGRAQRDVEHGAVLGDVDVLAGEHRVDPLAQAALLGQAHEQFDVVSVMRFFE